MSSAKVCEPAKAKSISAKDLYGRQNKIIHKGFLALCLPYFENKEYWLDSLSAICERRVSGLSEMTLAERRDLISHLKKQKAVSYNPFVPHSLKAWKTGDADQTALFDRLKQNFPGRPDKACFQDPDKGKMLKKIEAMLAEAKRPWAYAHSMAKKMAGVDRVQWCPPKQMHDIVSALMYDAVRHGRATTSGSHERL